LGRAPGCPPIFWSLKKGTKLLIFVSMSHPTSF